MNGLDLHTARRIQHPAEKAPCIVEAFGLWPMTEQRRQVLLQITLRHRGPARQGLGDTVRHFRRSRLGESEAQNTLWLGTGEQQLIWSSLSRASYPSFANY